MRCKLGCVALCKPTPAPWLKMRRCFRAGTFLYAYRVCAKKSIFFERVLGRLIRSGCAIALAIRSVDGVNVQLSQFISHRGQKSGREGGGLEKQKVPARPFGQTDRKSVV